MLAPPRLTALMLAANVGFVLIKQKKLLRLSSDLKFLLSGGGISFHVHGRPSVGGVSIRNYSGISPTGGGARSVHQTAANQILVKTNFRKYRRGQTSLTVSISASQLTMRKARLLRLCKLHLTGGVCRRRSQLAAG